MTKSLVTGGAGFIGSHLAAYLMSKGHEVIVVDDLSGGFERNIPEGAKFHELDITNEKGVEDLFNLHRFDYVFHLAAYAAEGLSHFIRRFNYENNLLGSINLINQSIKHKVKRFVFTSSMAVYGSQNPPYTEEMIPNPEDPYGTAKYAVEQDLKHAHEMFGLEYTIFRPHNVYGKNQHIGDSYRNVIGIFINQVLRKEPMTIFGDGKQTRAFSHISDIVPYIGDCVSMPETAGETFNVGGDRVYTINDLAGYITLYMTEYSPTIKHEPPRVEVTHAYSDHAKLEKFFHRTRPVPLEIGLHEMIEWAKELGPQAPTTFNGVEIIENLPPKWAALLKKDQQVDLASESMQ